MLAKEFLFDIPYTKLWFNHVNRQNEIYVKCKFYEETRFYRDILI